MNSLLAGIGVAACLATTPLHNAPVTSGAAPAAPPASVEIAAASASQPARRLTPPLQRHLVVLGDSIGASGQQQLADSLTANGWTIAAYNALGSRATINPDPTYDAVHAIRDIRDAGIDAPVWLVQLGTNDLYWVWNCGCADQNAAATARIRAVIDEIGPGHTIVWVNVNHRSWPDTTTTWNTALRQQQAAGSIQEIIDWKTASAGRHEYFADNAHLTQAGYTVWAPLIVDTLSRQA